MKKPADQQRNAERIPLSEPIDGSIDASEAKITELSLIGARVEHFNRLSMGSSASLQFTFKGKAIKLRGKVARTEMRSIRGKPGYVSGVNFVDRPEDAPKELRWIMGTFVEPIELEAEVEEPEPQPPPPPPEPKVVPKPAPPPVLATAPIQAMVTPRPFLPPDDDVEEIDGADEVQPYMRCEFQDDGGWTKTPTDDAKQPMSGFTMLAPETEDEVDDFCKTYEMADPDTQRMIRLSFELGIAQFRRK